MQNVTYIYYTHPLMIKSIFRENVKEYIDSVIGNNWRGFATNIDLNWYNFITETDEYGDLTSSFESMTAGVCLEQFNQITEGGVYVNPMLIGLLASYDQWFNHIRENFGYNTIFKKLHIPYEYFEPIFDEFLEELIEKQKQGIIDDEEGIPEKISKEEYEEYEESVEIIVHSLNVAVSVPDDYDVTKRSPICGTA